MAAPRLPKPHDPLLRAAGRHRFLIGSVALHVGVLAGLSQWQGQGLKEAELRANQPRIQAHTQAAAQQGARRRVDSLKAMKALAERIERSQGDSAQEPDGAPLPEAAASAAADPQALLAQARELRDSIQRLEQAAQARQLAEVLKLSPEEALAKVKQQAAEAAQRDAAADAAATAAGGDPVLQALNRYEQQAQEALQRLQAQQAQQQQGTTVQHGGGGAGAGASAGAGAGAGSGAGSGSGAGQSQADAAGAPGDGQGTGGGGSGRGDGRRSGLVGEAPRRYDGSQQTPAVARAGLQLGAGNALGAGGPYANRVFVDRWYVIGPFHAPNPESIHRLYPPEQWVDLDGVYLGKGRRVLRWQYISSASYPLIPPDAAENAIYYGYAEVRSDRARTVWLGLGADDDAKLWLNDRLVWVSGNQRKAWYTNGGVQSLQHDIRDRNLIEQRVRVTLRPGINRLLFKLWNNPLDVFFALVVEPVGEGG